MHSQIKATIIADSINAYTGVRLTTFEYEAPRIILAEINTHRVFSRNASSTRAIPVKTMLSKIWNDPFVPEYWGANQPGMQAKDQLKWFRRALAKAMWRTAGKTACIFAYLLSKIGLHKQLAGRVLEPWMIVKGVLSSTELDNWYRLRGHSDAQPEIQDLAHSMKLAQVESIPKKLYENQWHLPYVQTYEDGIGEFATQTYFNDEGVAIDLETAKKISASCCAQVSYRKNDTSMDKAEVIFGRLIDSEPRHLSPVEHQACPIKTSNKNEFNNNFRTWHQFRSDLDVG